MAFEVETVTEIEALLGTGDDDDWDFEAIEMAARRMAMRVAARAVEQRLNDDTSDHAGPTLPCACGQSARYADRHGKNFESVLGSLRLERVYYYCELCEEGFCPRDRALGLEGGSLSPGVRRMVGLVGAMVSFEEGHELLHELAGVNVPTKHVERAAEALGRETAVDEKLVVEPPRANEPLAPNAVPGDGWYGCTGAQGGVGGPPGQAARRLSQDARGQARHDLERRGAGQERHARARPGLDQLLGGDRECGAQGHRPDAERVRGARRARGHPARLRPRGAPDRARRWSQVDLEPHRRALSLRGSVDRFHAKQHLSDVAKSIHGAGSDLAQQWARERYDELDAGDIDAVLNALRLHSPKDDEARKCIDYVERNRERMRYPEFRAAGLCTSTGVVEAGCKVAIGTRCKRAGMHWTVAGANAIIALRCCKLSGRFEEFWERRAQRRVA